MYTELKWILIDRIKYTTSYNCDFERLLFYYISTRAANYYNKNIENFVLEMMNVLYENYPKIIKITFNPEVKEELKRHFYYVIYKVLFDKVNKTIKIDGIALIKKFINEGKNKHQKTERGNFIADSIEYIANIFSLTDSQKKELETHFGYLSNKKKN
jgi:hypothetical protein